VARAREARGTSGRRLEGADGPGPGTDPAHVAVAGGVWTVLAPSVRSADQRPARAARSTAVPDGIRGTFHAGQIATFPRFPSWHRENDRTTKNRSF
jgi:hypothetical protein